MVLPTSSRLWSKPWLYRRFSQNFLLQLLFLSLSEDSVFIVVSLPPPLSGDYHTTGPDSQECTFIRKPSPCINSNPSTYIALFPWFLTDVNLICPPKFANCGNNAIVYLHFWQLCVIHDTSYIPHNWPAIFVNYLWSIYSPKRQSDPTYAKIPFVLWNNSNLPVLSTLFQIREDPHVKSKKMSPHLSLSIFNRLYCRLR